jgi:F0F1-type ATP synthase assembly protein I
MTNEYLTFKNLLTVNSVVAVVYGLLFVLIPEDAVDLYDVSLDPTGALPIGVYMTQLFGASLISTGIFMWFIRDLSPSDMRRGITAAFFIGDVLGVIITLIMQLDDDVDANALGWSNVLVYLLLGLGYGYFLFMKPDESASA